MGGPGYGIKGEFAQNGVINQMKHTAGVLSMARAMHPNSAGSQFFIMHKDAPHLDGSYAAFGKITEGMDAVSYTHLEHFPAGTVEKMAKAGFMGIPVPKEYGGQGCDPLTYTMCVEELSKVCATTGVIVSAHTSLCIDPIMTCLLYTSRCV